jgi:hypothetical protein
MEPITIRLLSYKSFRHYGGREITATPHLCKALFIKRQIDHTNVVELLEDCAGYSKGHIIAVSDNDFNV